MFNPSYRIRYIHRLIFIRISRLKKTIQEHLNIGETFNILDFLS